MLLHRALRRLAAPSALLSAPLKRLNLPIRTQFLSVSASTSSGEPSIPSEPIRPELKDPVSSTTQTEQTEQAEQAAPKKPGKLPYFVARNNLNNLGVYHRNKRGGNLKVTLVKNGEGDLMALKRDLQEALQLKDNEIAFNSITGHIVIRGHVKLQVFNFLYSMGF
ncbi:mitochondrial large subunit ribosomal protein-domain-containing protein [Daldinia vernicosa]|uniref:mitochondrial large subunit ribosomal protein-domain-containing protein n=1 Tax=Daldinia vernicosa TaxID=114800 RepID=UPI002008CFEC|nr:mitochondrial large subunit ribosomal protein-domain-containing protein [Daldinia vernicosa]KAI0849360.1 mitochondrial large subunit ribosomal protein-domain-containing protein [Daldinia vernicosa]